MGPHTQAIDQDQSCPVLGGRAGSVQPRHKSKDDFPRAGAACQCHFFNQIWLLRCSAACLPISCPLLPAVKMLTPIDLDLKHL